MPEDFADFGQGGTVAQHISRQRVAKLMSALCRGLDTGMLECMPNDRSNSTLAQETTDGSFVAQKNATTRAARAPAAQVGRDCRADIARKGKGGSLIAFTPDAHLSGVPVNILKLEKGHLS